MILNPISSPSRIIAYAISLGVMCRPVNGDNSPRLLGAAYKPTMNGWYLWEPNSTRTASPLPIEFTCQWELVTEEIIRKEWIRLSEEPW